MIYTVSHTLIDGYRSYLPFWLHDVAGADLRPDTYFYCNESYARFLEEY
jgi:hypothetical protein